MEKIKIQDSDIVIGDPLAWPVFSVTGQLLLSEGYVLKTENQKKMLLSQDLYRNPTLEEEIEQQNTGFFTNKLPAICPFETLSSIKSILRSVVTDIYKNSKADHNQTILNLALIVQNLCREHVDPAMGALILDQDSPYIDLHPVLCGILTEILNKRRKIPEQDRIPFIAAALTQNIGMWHEQDILSTQTTPLTDKQRKVIIEHPYKSREIMKAANIDNKDWLDTIFFHHERIDGKGYPSGLVGDAIPESARILAIADIYSAMILPRQYRDGLYVKKALRDIFMQRGSTVDENITQLLIKEIGIYPPGAFVMLNNGEIAIVLKHNISQANCPIVLSVISPRGLPYEFPRKRDTEQEQIFAIEKVISRPENFKVDLNQIWAISSAK
ncbi:MAG: HD domain-containing protein [Methylococcaceae bacterium]|nr:HD domain-containing protein [Methylococcaceae bacterium]